MPNIKDFFHLAFITLALENGFEEDDKVTSLLLLLLTGDLILYGDMLVCACVCVCACVLRREC